jgi:hypothetical protein
MGLLNESSAFEPSVYQVETTDPLAGGPVTANTGTGSGNAGHGDGILNLAARQLANRTRWLYDFLRAGTLAAGDLLYATGAAAVARLPIGPAGRVLRSSGSTPTWGLLGAAQEVQIPIMGSPTPTSTQSGVFVEMPGRFEFVVDRSWFPGSAVTFIYEAVFDAENLANEGTAFTELYDLTGGAAVPNSELSWIYFHGTALRARRTVTFPTEAGERSYVIRGRVNGNTRCRIYAARLIVRITP